MIEKISEFFEKNPKTTNILIKLLWIIGILGVPLVAALIWHWLSYSMSFDGAVMWCYEIEIVLVYIGTRC